MLSTPTRSHAGTYAPAISFWLNQFRVKAQIHFENVKQEPCDSLMTALRCTDMKSDSSSNSEQFKWNWPHQWSNSAGEWVQCTVSCSPNPTCSGVLMLPCVCNKGVSVGLCANLSPRILPHSLPPTPYQSPHTVFIPMSWTCGRPAGWIEVE